MWPGNRDVCVQHFKSCDRYIASKRQSWTANDIILASANQEISPELLNKSKLNYTVIKMETSKCVDILLLSIFFTNVYILWFGKIERLVAVVNLVEANDSGTTGKLYLYESRNSDQVTIQGYINNLNPGEHGFHVHTNGATDNECGDAGGHFNPTNVSTRYSNYRVVPL